MQTDRNRQREWTVAEKTTLRELWLDGVKMLEICAILGRGKDGIDHQRRMMKLPARTPARVRTKRVKSKAERLDAAPFPNNRDAEHVEAILAEREFPALDVPAAYRVAA